MAYSEALAALADPTRRQLFERLGRRDHTVGELATLARITQPAASQHLRVLKDARLVTSRNEGTRRYYRASREGLDELRRYLESFWDDALEAFAAAPEDAARIVAAAPCVPLTEPFPDSHAATRKLARDKKKGRRP